MPPFLQLLPSRIEQAIAWRALRTMRVRRSRASMPTLPELPTGPRRLFIDLAVISGHDAGTGIQRVVREIALALLNENPADWDIRFVSARRKKRYFRIAWPDQAEDVDAEEMCAQPGDVFLGLDYSLDAVRRHRRQLERFRHDGGSLWFLVHDLLPLQRPDWFSRNTVIRYKAWLGVLAKLADGFLCNSAHTETELKRALADIYGLETGYRTEVLPMGHAIPRKQQGRTVPPPVDSTPRFDLSTSFALMVGTLEPRKGHADVIAAFNELWNRGSTDRLVLVGRLGWQVDALRTLIMAHPEHGTKLLWFDDVGDAELVGFYEACSGVIIASHGEGFGLPLIEALGHGKPVLARDLPVFRPHEGKGVHYFPANAPTPILAAALQQWLVDARGRAIPVTRPTADWGDAAIILMAAIRRIE